MNGKLEMLVIIVNQGRKDYYLEILNKYDVKLQYVAVGRGTASSEMRDYYHIENSTKDVIVCIIKIAQKEQILNEISLELNENCKGAAFTMPYSEIINKRTYDFLCIDSLVEEVE